MLSCQIPAFVALMATFAAAVPIASQAASVVVRDPEAAKEYIHFDTDVLDKRSPGAKEYIHFDTDVLDKRSPEAAAKEYIHFDTDVLDK